MNDQSIDIIESIKSAESRSSVAIIGRDADAAARHATVRKPDMGDRAALEDIDQGYRSGHMGCVRGIVALVINSGQDSPVSCQSRCYRLSYESQVGHCPSVSYVDH